MMATAHTIKKYLPYALLCLLVALFYAGGQYAHSQSGGALTGWAWSDTVGWLSLSGSGYGLTTGGGTVTGYAWSDNIGWVSANAADTATCGSGGASINGTALSGWLRALAGGTAQSGGWDGCISLNGSGYQVTTAANSSYTTNYAWGSDVVGWLSFNTGGASCTPASVCSDATHSQYTDASCQVTITDCGALGCNSGTGLCNAPALASGYLSWSATSNVESTRVRKNYSAQLYWSVAGVDTCSISRNPAASGWPMAVDPAQGAVGVSSGAITGSAVYTLSCTGTGTSLTDTAFINILPVYQEI